MARRKSRLAAPAADGSGDDPHKLLGFRLPLLSNIWSALGARQFARLFGLKQLEARVLFVIGITDAVTLKHLGQYAGIEKAYASRTTAALVDSGLLLKRIDPGDRRSVRLELTEAGRATFEALLRESRERDDALAAVLTAAERRNLHDYLDRLIRHAREMAASEPRNA